MRRRRRTLDVLMSPIMVLVFSAGATMGLLVASLWGVLK